MIGGLCLSCLHYTFSTAACSVLSFGSEIPSFLLWRSASHKVQTWCPWIYILQHKSERAGQQKYNFYCTVVCWMWWALCGLYPLFSAEHSLHHFQSVDLCVCSAGHTDCQWQLHNWLSSQCSTVASSSSLDIALNEIQPGGFGFKMESELILLLLFSLNG